MMALAVGTRFEKPAGPAAPAAVASLWSTGWSTCTATRRTQAKRPALRA